MKFELRPARPADVEAIMQVMADAMANLQHPEWFVPDDAVYMAEQPQGFLPGGGGKNDRRTGSVFYR